MCAGSISGCGPVRHTRKKRPSRRTQGGQGNELTAQPAGNPQHRILKLSFCIKVVFVGLAIALSVAFTATTYMRNFHVGAPLEWCVGFLFGLFIVSFAVDLYPAVHTKNGAFFAPDKDALARRGESSDDGRRADVEMALRGAEPSRRSASELSRDSEEMREVRHIETLDHKD